MTPTAEIRGLHKRFGDLDVLKGIDLGFLPGEAVVLLGSRRSGKSTLLRCIGLMEGQVIELGRSKAEARDKAMQQLARAGLEDKAPAYPARLPDWATTARNAP